MRRKDELINQRFTSDKDVKEQVAELAERMTLAIRDELLIGRCTPQREALHQKGGLQGVYHSIKDWLNQQKSEILIGQTLSNPQKLALADVDRLLEELPTLARNSKDYSYDIYLQKLMNDPDYHLDKDLILQNIPNFEVKTMSTNKPTPSALIRKKREHYSAKCKEYLNHLHQQIERDYPWKTIQSTLEELEAALLGLAEEEGADYLPLLLAELCNPIQTLSEQQTSTKSGDRLSRETMMTQFKQQLVTLCKDQQYQFRLSRPRPDKLLIQVENEGKQMQTHLSSAVELLKKMVAETNTTICSFEITPNWETGLLTITTEPKLMDQIADLLQEAGSTYWTSVTQVRAALFYNSLEKSVTDNRDEVSVVICALQ